MGRRNYRRAIDLCRTSTQPQGRIDYALTLFHDLPSYGLCAEHRSRATDRNHLDVLYFGYQKIPIEVGLGAPTDSAMDGDAIHTLYICTLQVSSEAPDIA